MAPTSHQDVASQWTLAATTRNERPCRVVRCLKTLKHRRTSQGADRGAVWGAAAQPLQSGKAIIFRTNAEFSGRSQQPKIFLKSTY